MAQAAVAAKIWGPKPSVRLVSRKKTNYALQPQSKEEFIAAVTDGLSVPPKYFAINAQINMQGYESLDNIKQKGLTPLSIS